MGHQYDHRFGSFRGLGDTDLETVDHHDPRSAVMPRYWVRGEEATGRLARRPFGSSVGLLGHRRVARSNDERTAIAAVIPWGAASYGWILTTGPVASDLSALCAVFNSFVFDYCLRNALSQPSVPQGTSEQLPVPPPHRFTEPAPWDQDSEPTTLIRPRTLELIYTAWDMQPFARDLGDDRAPFVWDGGRRSLLRAELDAAMFHLYEVRREDVDYIMDTFPIVRRKDEARYGEYRTKRLILEVYDAMQVAIDTGEPYQTILDPPPGEGPRHPDQEDQ